MNQGLNLYIPTWQIKVKIRVIQKEYRVDSNFYVIIFNNLIFDLSIIHFVNKGNTTK